jgi:hypothetical protein
MLIPLPILLALQAGPSADALRWQRVEQSGFTILYTDADSASVGALAPMLARGRARVEGYFGAPFPQAVEVRLYPDRAALTERWRQAWGVPDLQAQCWMVASGTARELDVLSPRVWRSDACEHDPGDAGHTERILTHELTHVYHGQHSPHPDFDGMDDLGWFVEGLAVVVSGQLEAEHQGRAARAIAEGRVPPHLADVWSGPYRYGVAGSLTDWVDRTWGRAVTVRLLTMTTPAEVLAALGVSEDELLARWRAAAAR